MSAFGFPFEFAMPAIPGDEPSDEEANRGPEAETWKESKKEEIQRLHEMGTWELVKRTPEMEVVKSKWVHKKKRDENNAVVRHKSRLVACGYSQTFGINYFDTSSPTIRPSSVKLLLALAAQHDWALGQMDFRNAYLNGDLHELVYMTQPRGFEEPGKEDYVCRLLKPIYGLKQAGNEWYKKVKDLFESLRLTVSSYDHGVFYLHSGDVTIIVGLHVDDCPIAASTDGVLERFKSEVRARFKIVDLGEARWLLGFEIRRDRARRTISIAQPGYIDSMLERFGMKDAKPLAVPLDPHVNLFIDLSDDEREWARQQDFPVLIGALIWIAIISRPDIAFTVSTLSRFLANPGRIHIEAAKRVLRYLKGTQDYVLTFGDGDPELEGKLDAFSNSDWASQAHRHSITGNIFMFNGGAVSWMSRKQPIIALSTMEAKIIAASECAREVHYLQHLLGELTGRLHCPTTLHCNNQSAIAVAKNGFLNARTKHIDIRYLYMRKAVDDNTIKIVYCPTNEMAADLLTKALPKEKLEYL